MTLPFQSIHSFDDRKKESSRLRTTYPDRIPIILEKDPNAKIPRLQKVKFLVPCVLHVSEFLYFIRTQIKLNPEDSIFFFIQDVLPSSSDTMMEVHTKYAHKDGFLYVIYTTENTFG